MQIDPADGAAVLAATAAATSHLYIGAAGLAVRRYRTPAAPLFAVACVAVAWATLGTALQRPLAPVWPAVYAISPLLSGYGFPALTLFTLRAIDPKRAPSPAWLALGLPGTVYALLVLASPAHLAFIVAYRAGTGPRWDPVLSPFYLAHCVQMAACAAWSGTALLRALRRAPPGPYRQALGWLAAAHGMALAALALYSVLPGVNVLGALALAPWSTSVPMLAFLYQALRAMSEGPDRERQAEAAQRRLDSVAEATRGISERIAALVADAAAHADAWNTPGALATERRRHGEELRRLLGEIERWTARMTRYARGGEAAAVPVDAAGRARTAARAASERAGRRTAVEVAADAEAARVRVAPEALDAAIDALVTNALEAGAAAPVVRVRVERPAVVPADALHPAMDGEDALRIDVVDTGEGMDPRARERAVEPFFTTRPGHAGLGLVDVVALVRSAGGALHLASAPGAGTTVAMWLPLYPAPPVPAPVAATRCDADVALISDDRARTTPLGLLLDARGLRAAVYPTAAAARSALLPGSATMPAVLVDLDSTDADMLALAHDLARAARGLTVLGGRPTDTLALRAAGEVHRMARGFRLSTVAAHLQARAATPPARTA